MTAIRESTRPDTVTVPAPHPREPRRALFGLLLALGGLVTAAWVVGLVIAAVWLVARLL